MKYTTEILPKNGWFDLKIREIWRYRDLILLFVRRDFVALYKQTILGPAWAIIQPLMTTIIFTVVFGKMAGLSAKGVPPFLFYMSGTVCWGYFSNCLTRTASTFISNQSILGKVYFPRLVMPISTVLSNLISFMIQFFFFFSFIVYYAYNGMTLQISLCVLMLPLIVLQMAMLGLGFGIILSAFTTKYRDLTMLISFGVQLWMYVTPVAYDIHMIPEKYISLYQLNPITPVLSLFRWSFLGIGEANWFYYGISWLLTIFVLFLGVVLFSRVEKTFMDTI